MKKSVEPTSYVLVKAWGYNADKCDFALVQFGEDDLEDLRSYVTTAKLAEAGATNNFCSISYYVSVIGYFKVNEYLPQAELDEILGDDEFAFVETSDDEIRELESTQGAVNEERLEVDSDGNFFYVAMEYDSHIIFETSIINFSALEKYYGGL